MVTSEKPFFDPAASTSQQIVGLATWPSVVSTTSTSPVQATWDVTNFSATQPVEAPGARLVVHSKANGASSEEVQATRPVEQSITGKKILQCVCSLG